MDINNYLFGEGFDFNIPSFLMSDWGWATYLGFAIWVAKKVRQYNISTSYIVGYEPTLEDIVSFTTETC